MIHRSANQRHFNLSIDGVSHDLQVLAFTGRESISQVYEFVLELVSERPDLDLQSLLHKTAFLAFNPNNLGIHGLIESARRGQSGKRLTRYQEILRPK